MMPNSPPRTDRLRLVRVLLWLLVAAAVLGAAALLLMPRPPSDVSATQSAVQNSFGGPFTLVGADGKPFPSSRLAGKPYAMYFGYTRCGDTCPTTLSRMVRLRQSAGGADALNIVFVTIDPANDGPKEVGQYATLFNAPITGLTGSAAQIAAVKKQYGIYAQPEPAADGHGMTMINHTATVLLFDRASKFAGTIAGDEADSAAIAKLKRMTGA